MTLAASKVVDIGSLQKEIRFGLSNIRGCFSSEDVLGEGSTEAVTTLAFVVTSAEAAETPETETALLTGFSTTTDLRSCPLLTGTLPVVFVLDELSDGLCC